MSKTNQVPAVPRSLRNNLGSVWRACTNDNDDDDDDDGVSWTSLGPVVFVLLVTSVLRRTAKTKPGRHPRPSRIRQVMVECVPRVMSKMQVVTGTVKKPTPCMEKVRATDLGRSMDVCFDSAEMVAASG